jgi:hypothetical protein
MDANYATKDDLYGLYEQVLQLSKHVGIIMDHVP